MNNLDNKIKESKNVIEESNINNPDEIYTNVQKKYEYENKDNKNNKVKILIDSKYIFRFCLIALLLITITITSMAIYSVNTPKVIVKDKNTLTSGLSQKLSNKVQNVSSELQLRKVLLNSLIYEEDNMIAGGDSSMSPGDSVHPDVDIEHSYNTNIQVDGIDEGDIVKVNGNYIYYVTNEGAEYSSSETITRSQNALYILKANGNSIDAIKTILFPKEEREIAKNEEATVIEYSTYIPEELLYTDKYIILSVAVSITTKVAYNGRTSSSEYNQYNELFIYDTNNYELVTKIKVPGYGINTRLIDNQLYVISNYYDYRRNDYQNVIPQYGINDQLYSADIEKIFYCPGMGAYISSYIVIFRITLGTNITIEDNYFLAPPVNNVYVNENAIYLINQYSTTTEQADNIVAKYNSSKVLCVDIKGDIKFNDIIEVKGQINGKYWIDEYKGYLRVASTGTVQTYKLVGGKYKYGSTSKIFNYLTIYKKDSNGCYQEVNAITEGLGEEGERIQSVRFNKDVATIVTFKQTDPLYYVDLSNPANPKITSELKVTGFSTYQHPYKDNYVIGIGYETSNSGGTIGYKIALYDISDKANIKQVGEPIVFMNADGYRSLDAVNDPKELFLDLDNDIFGFKMDYYTKKTDESGKVYYEYSEKYFLFEIDLAEENPLSIFFEQTSEIHSNRYSFEEYSRMIFIKDKYYLLSYDKVLIYKLTKDELEFIDQFTLY